MSDSNNYRNEIKYDNTYWDDLKISPNNVRFLGAAPATYTDYRGSGVLTFAHGATNTVQFEVQMPHAMKEGTDLEVHFHYSPAATDAGNSVWAFTHSWANIDGSFPGETTVNKTLVGGSQHDHLLGEVTTIDGTGKTFSSVMLCSLSRLGADGLDTSTQDTYIVSIDFHYQIDAPGSAEEYRKH